MTREEANELLPIIQAFAEGKTIQVRINNDSSWTDLLDTKLEISNLYKYRIKPEPKYRPFNSKEECWEEMLKHNPFGWVKNKDAQYINPLSIGDDKDFVKWFKLYTFADDTPFGIKEQ